MAIIPQKELRNDVGAVLRRAERGERLTVTVSGRPVAEIGPVRRSSWLPAAQTAAIFRTPADPTALDDLRALPGELTDPFER